MSIKVMSQSSESSPNTAKTPSNIFNSSTSNYFPNTTTTTATTTTQNKQALSRKNSSSKTVPSFIITDTTTTSNNDTTTQKPKVSNSLMTQYKQQQHDSSKASSPTFFNVKKNLTNNHILPSSVLPKTGPELTKEFLTSADAIVIDVRPYTLYLQARLVNALNICVPTTLLKRKAFVLKNIIGSMQKFQQDYINCKLENNERLDFILYDNTSSIENCSFHLYQTCLKVLDYTNTLDNSKCTVSILQNGISSVNSSSEIMDSSEVPVLSPLSPNFSDLTASPSSNKTANSMSNSPVSSNYCFASLSGFSLPSANDFSSSFAASIKKNREKTGVEYHSENDIVHLPESSKLNAENVPKWLQPFLNPVEGFELIHKRFIKIEDIESIRLENVAKLNIPGAENNSGKHCCSGGLCSPSAPCPECDQISYTLPEGIEYGDKNRYSNIWPYEHSRVKILHSPLVVNPPSLSNFESSDGSDYFNANYVTVPKVSDNRYIATQAPLPSTFDDFWRAVWYNKVETVICLTNLNEGGLKKSDNYWQDCVYQSGLDVKLLAEVLDEESNIVIRTLQLQKTSSQTKIKEKKLVKQIEFKEWPDFGVPPSPKSIIRLINLKESFVRDRRAPIVVHCSAGCGRTGTFITIDVLLQMLWSTLENSSSSTSSTPLLRKSSLRSPFGQLDRQLLFKNKISDSDTILKKFKWWGEDDLVYKTVNILRRQRLSMVQTLNQYLICYETLLLAINDSYEAAVV